MSPGWQVGATVLTGTLVYVLGQIFQRFVLDPIHEQKKILGEIATATVFLANLAHVGRLREMQVMLPEEPAAAALRLRSIAARLHGTLWTIPLYGVWATLRLVPPKKTVREAATQIIGWSNSLDSGNAITAREKVAKLLGIPSLD